MYWIKSNSYKLIQATFIFEYGESKEQSSGNAVNILFYPVNLILRKVGEDDRIC